MAAPRVARAPDPELALGPGAAPRYQRTRHLPGAKLEDLLVEHRCAILYSLEGMFRDVQFSCSTTSGFCAQQWF